MHKKMAASYIFFCVVLIIGISLILTRDSGPESPEKKELLYIHSSPATGAPFAACAAWSRLITANTEFIAVNSASPSTMNEKINLLMSGEIDLAFITGPAGYIAYNGHPDYWNHPRNIRALFGLWPAVYNSVVYKDSGIKTIKDLKGKRIALYSDRSLDGNILAYLLELNGITPENTTIFRVRESIGEKMFSRKEVDFIWYNLGQGNSFLEKYLTPNADNNSFENFDEIFFIPLSEKDMLRELLAVYPVFYTDDFLFDNQNDKAENQLKTSNFIACSVYMPDELAYKLTRLWWENIDYIKQFTSNKLEVDSFRNIKNGIPVPLHPGAEKYFDEAGINY